MNTHRTSLTTQVYTVLTAYVALLSACNNKLNSNWCPGRNPNDNCYEDPAPKACSSNNDCGPPVGVCDMDTKMCVQCAASADCAAPTAACDTQSKTCVQCTESETSACTGTTPVCETDHTCQSCTSHAQCKDSNACLPDGSCALLAKVAYVAAAPTGSDNQRCGLSNPCATVGAALATGLPYVKFHGTIDEAVTVDNGRVVTFLADQGAKLKHSSGEPILTVRGDGTSLDVYDLSISEAPNSTSGFGLLIPTGSGSPTVSLTRVTLANDPAQGISASGGTLRISQCTITNNAGGGIVTSGSALSVSRSTISNNVGGGIAIMNGTFAIVGNVLVNNGNDPTAVGGLAISAAENASNRVDFNSFTQNKAQIGIGTAIHCNAGALTARNNIMSDNGTIMNAIQVGGACMHAYSIVRPGVPPMGTGNKPDDPRFKNAAMGDLHIQPGSPAIGAADPAADLTGIAARDIDGDQRKARADIGADQIP